MLCTKARTMLVALTVCALLANSAAAAPPPEPKPVDLADNAALQYWVAIYRLGELEAKLEIDWERVGHWVEGKAAIDAEAVNIIQSSCDYDVLDKYLSSGVQRKHCDWGVPYEDGPTMYLPYDGAVRRLGQVSCLRARQRFESGDIEGGMRDVFAAMTLARHWASSGIGHFVLQGITHEDDAREVLLAYLDRLDPAQLKLCQARLDDLPALPDPRQVVLTEKRAMITWARQALQDGRRDELARSASDNNPYIEMFKTLNNEQIVDAIDQWAGFYDQAADRAYVPHEQLQVEADKLKEQIDRSGNCLAVECGTDYLFTTVSYMLRQQTRVAMLRAAIVYLLEGPEAFNKIQDPTGDGPFAFSETAHGFQLTAEIMRNGRSKPLAVGYPPIVRVVLGQALPDMGNLNVPLARAQIEAKAVLVAFFGIKQRPSRRFLEQLTTKANALTEQGIITIGVQASPVDEQELKEILKKAYVPFPVGMIQADVAAVRAAWGVNALPWLLLADRDHVVVAEGFQLEDLDRELAKLATAP